MNQQQQQQQQQQANAASSLHLSTLSANTSINTSSKKTILQHHFRSHWFVDRLFPIKTQLSSHLVVIEQSASSPTRTGRTRRATRSSSVASATTAPIRRATCVATWRRSIASRSSSRPKAWSLSRPTRLRAPSIATKPNVSVIILHNNTN